MVGAFFHFVSRTSRVKDVFSPAKQAPHNHSSNVPAHKDGLP